MPRGDVLYEIVDTGLQAPERERKGKTDGVKCVMLGGSGPAARSGYTVTDSEDHIRRDMATGITSVVPESEKAAIISHYESKAQVGQPGRSMTGCMEV